MPGTNVTFGRYVALGDSATEGLEDPYPDGRGYRGWADRLAEHVAEHNPELLYANLAVRGRKVGQVRAEQLPAALELEPDLASVVAGVNDVLRRHVDLERVVADVEAMVADLRRAGATVVADLRRAGATVVVMTYLDPARIVRIMGGTVSARVRDLNAGVRSIAERHGAVLVDFEHDGVADARLWAPDRLHANAEGHARIAAAAAEALGLAEPTRGWAEPLPPLRGRPAPIAVAGEVAWAGRHLAPWVLRRVRGRSSGDGRVAKRPRLEPLR